jgi:hypothetical protein
VNKIRILQNGQKYLLRNVENTWDLIDEIYRIGMQLTTMYLRLRPH